MFARHILAQLAQHLRLRFCQLESQLCQEWFDQTVVSHTRQGLRLLLKVFPSSLDLELQFDELVQRQFAASQFSLLDSLREMQLANGERTGEFCARLLEGNIEFGGSGRVTLRTGVGFRQ